MGWIYLLSFVCMVLAVI